MASMHALVSLASALNNADADGRVVIDAAGGSLKFLLLNAAAHFAKVWLPLSVGHTRIQVPSLVACSCHLFAKSLCLDRFFPLAATAEMRSDLEACHL